jgi:hypothetical protein
MTRRLRAKFLGGASGRRAEVLRAIAAAADLTTAERCVLFVIEAHVSYADRDTGEAWPSVATIGRCAGMSERHARRAIAQLHAAGWLRVRARLKAGAQLSSAYTVTPPEAGADEPSDDAPPVH